MRTIVRFGADPGKAVVFALAALFFVVCTWASYARWANFGYRTFDLAYYVQAIWQLIHGRFQVSVQNVPLLGNHVEPIVFLFAPLFAVFRHPILFVVVQNAALAAMAPIGYGIAKRLGFDGLRACFLSSPLLLTPAAGYIALHEFHPEALAAPFLLLMFHARLSNSVPRHWLWFAAVLACKENMALLLAAYCAVHCVIERKRGLAELRSWYLWPMVAAILWFVLCSAVITPTFNAGNIDYLALYDRLGTSPGDILRNAVTQPYLIGRALAHSLTHGNLVWALLFPFFCLPLLRPRWLLIAVPAILQHLLSWRSSEWTIYFHYSAPVLPLFWMALVETVAMINAWKPVPVLARRAIPLLPVFSCLVAQVLLGPAAGIVSATTDWFGGASDRARKKAFIGDISSQASLLAPLPYLSHLAMREKLYSLHYVLKGLKTLSRASYELPPPTDFVLIDYGDATTFDPVSGYYHPAMQTVDGRIIPSSDRLLHDFLKRSQWIVNARDELTLLRRSDRVVQTGLGAVATGGETGLEIASHTILVGIHRVGEETSNNQPLVIRLQWKFDGEREVFPWMFLRLRRPGQTHETILPKGLCAPEASAGSYEEIWHLTAGQRLPAGDYAMEAIFVDNSKRAWLDAKGQANQRPNLLSNPIPLGSIKLQ